MGCRVARPKPKNNKIAMTGCKPTTYRMRHCEVCGKDGHNRDGCFKLIGYPEWWPGKGRQEKTETKTTNVKTEESPIPGLNNEQYQQFLNIFAQRNRSIEDGVPTIANTIGKVYHGDDWIIDSGATEHMTHITDWLEGKTETTHELPVTIPNGDSIPVEGKGVCNLPNM